MIQNDIYINKRYKDMKSVNEEKLRKKIENIVSEVYSNHVEDMRVRQFNNRRTETDKKNRLIDALSEAILSIYGDIPVNKTSLSFIIDPIINQIHSWERKKGIR
jgi:hypothetical protein